MPFSPMDVPVVKEPRQALAKHTRLARSRMALADGVAVTARRGAKRTPAQVQALLKSALPRKDVEILLSDPSRRRALVEACEVITWDGKTARQNPLRDIASTPLSTLDPVRRLGSYKGARANVGIHITRVSGHTRALFAESKLEALWMTALDRRADVTGYRTQAFYMVWPVGDHYIVQVPDLVVSSDRGVSIMSVRPDDLMEGYSHLMLAELLPESSSKHGLGYCHLGSISWQHTVNLRALGALRWKPTVTTEAWWSAGQPGTSTTMVRLAAKFGGGASGRGRALRAVAQCHLDLDLDYPIFDQTEVTWR